MKLIKKPSEKMYEFVVRLTESALERTGNEYVSPAEVLASVDRRSVDTNKHKVQCSLTIAWQRELIERKKVQGIFRYKVKGESKRTQNPLYDPKKFLPDPTYKKGWVSYTPTVTYSNDKATLSDLIQAFGVTKKGITKRFNKFMFDTSVAELKKDLSTKQIMQLLSYFIEE